MYTLSKDIIKGLVYPTQDKGRMTSRGFREDMKLSPNTPWFAYKAMMEVADLKSERAKLDDEHKKAFAELQKCQERMDIEDKCQKTLIVDLESRAADFESQFSALADELATERSKAQTLFDERSTLQAKADALQAEADAFQAKVNTLSSEVTDIQAVLSLAQAETEANRRMTANMNLALTSEHQSSIRHKSSMDKRIRQLEESKSLTRKELKNTQQALDATASLHVAAETKAIDLQRQLEVLSVTLSDVQREKEEVQASLERERSHVERLEGELVRANGLLLEANGRAAGLQAEIDFMKMPTIVFEASSSDLHMSSLDEAAFAIQLENELLESQAEEEEVRHAEVEADLSSQLAAALAEVARLKAREDSLVFENTTLKTQLTAEVKLRNDAIFDVRTALDEQAALSTQNEDLKARLEVSESALVSAKASAEIHLAARDAALQQLDEQREQTEAELCARVEEEEKAHFVMAELNREKRELASAVKTAQDALSLKNHRCAELEREIGTIAATLNGFSSNLPPTPLPATPQLTKAALMDKENVSVSNKLLSRFSGLRRQTTLPFSSSSNLGTTLSSMQIPDSPSPSDMNAMISFHSLY